MFIKRQTKAPRGDAFKVWSIFVTTKGPKFKHVGEQDVKAMLYPLSLGLKAIANNC